VRGQQRMISWQGSLSRRSVASGGLILGVSSAVAITVYSCDAQTLQQEKHLTHTTRASEEIVVEGEAQADEFCNSAEPPQLFLDRRPDHGTVCFESGEFEVGEAVTGDLACLGRMVRGVNIIYRPRPGYTGADRLRYTAIGAQSPHSVSIDLTVLPGKPTSAVVPPDRSAPPAESAMLLGPMPACVAPVS
jgi:hypothetical protein